jgi:hypothetical protein
MRVFSPPCRRQRTASEFRNGKLRGDTPAILRKTVEGPDWKRARCGYSGEIVWVTPGEVLLTGKRFVYVRVPAAAENAAKARNAYESGMARGSGVLFSAVCEIDGVAYCYAWSPERFEDGQQGLWTRGLKMSAKSEGSRIPAKVVQSALQWKWLRWRYRKKQSLKEFLIQ